MSESGLPGIPNATVSLLQSGGKAQAAPKNSVEITRLPESLRRTDKATILRGKVGRHEHGDQVRIKTERGEITVKTDTPQRLPEGEDVEIRLPKGEPPVTASVRPAPPQQSGQPRVPDTAEHIDVQPETLVRQPLASGQEVKLVPLSPAQVKNIVALPLKALPPAVLQKADHLSVSVKGDLATPVLALVAEGHAPLPSPQGIYEAFIKGGMTPLSGDAPPVVETHLSDIMPDVLPLRAIISRLIKQPLQEPITARLKDGALAGDLAQSASPSPLEHAEIGQVVAVFSHEGGEFIHFKSSSAPNALSEFVRAGQIEAQIIGTTREREFPVLRILSPLSREGQVFAIARSLEGKAEHGRLSLVPLEALPEPVLSSSDGVVPAVMPSLPSVSVAAFLPLALPAGGSWPVLDEVYQALAQHAPQSAQVMQAMVPNTAAPARLAGTALFFIAAMRSGDVQSWLGDKAVEALRRAGKNDLLTRLARETGDISRNEHSAHDWRTMSLPLMHGTQMHRILLHYRKEYREGREDSVKKGGTTRFVMDMALSHMGKLQIDGLFQEGAGGKGGRLDVILRSEQSFSQNMHQEMRGLYKRALDETGFTGELSFQDAPEGWVSIHQRQDPQFERKI